MAFSKSQTRIIRFAIVILFIFGCGYILSSGSSFNVEVEKDVSKGNNELSKGTSSNADTPVKENAVPIVQDTTPKQATQKGQDVISKENGVGKTTGGTVKAAFVVLARNSDLQPLLNSIRTIEDRFNNKYNYDWVFFNDDDFSEEFMKVVSAVVSGKAKFGKVPPEHWGFPEWIDTEKAAKVREEMKTKQIIYGDSISYRHMCRFYSGFFYQQPLMNEYEYYWRVDPDIKIFCDINYDIFQFMKDQKKEYAFTISLPEYGETIPTLWKTTKEFIEANPQYVAKDNLLDWVSDDKGSTYNGCHFWSNFEVASLDFMRSEAYRKYFEHLDQAGGFFYERWGDAPVHSIAVSLFMPKEKVHFFEDIGYYHVPFNNCPIDEEIRIKNKCVCDHTKDFTWNKYSCTTKFFTLTNRPKLKGWEAFHV